MSHRDFSVPAIHREFDGAVLPVCGGAALMRAKWLFENSLGDQPPVQQQAGESDTNHGGETPSSGSAWKPTKIPNHRGPSAKAEVEADAEAMRSLTAAHGAWRRALRERPSDHASACPGVNQTDTLRDIARPVKIAFLQGHEDPRHSHSNYLQSFDSRHDGFNI